MVSLTPRPIYPREKDPGIHWIGDWVGPKAGVDTVLKRKIPSPNYYLLTIHNHHFIPRHMLTQCREITSSLYS